MNRPGLRASLVVTALGALAATVGPAASTEAAFPGRNGAFAFQGGLNGIYVAQNAGGNATKIVAGREPSVTPDGSSVAYVATRPRSHPIYFDSKGNEIFSASIDGSHRERLTHNNLIDVEPAYSPDGRKIAFARFLPRRNSYEIFEMDADGSRVRRLTYSGHDGAALAPTFSPDGHHIAYLGSGGQISVMRSNGSHRRTVRLPAHLTEIHSRVDYAPNGRRIVFAAARPYGPSVNIYSTRVRGGNPRKLAVGERRLSLLDPVYSPNGRRIAYTARHDLNGRSRVRIARRNGTHQRRVEGSPKVQSSPSWAPG